MKKRILAFLLCVLLLSGTAYATAGDANDPLVTLSWLADTWLPGVKASLASIADKAVADYQSSAAAATPAKKSQTVHPGESLRLTAGQHFVMTSGAATLSVAKGAVVNATQDWETSGGAVRAGNRYIVCEDAEAYLDVHEDTDVVVSYAAETGRGCPFTDVRRGVWYFSAVMNAYADRLVNGSSATTYSPNGLLSYAECIKLAACMHQRRHTQSVTLHAGTDGVPWYRPYVDYALENGLLDAELDDYTRTITRREFVRMFYRAMPVSDYTVRNSIADGSIPDTPMDALCAQEIYTFYRAGILSGFSGTPGYAEHAFGPDSTISRAEVAAIMNRMFDANARVNVQLEAE